MQARFLLDGTAGGPDLAFLDSELLLPPTSHEDCLLATTAAGGVGGSGGPGWVAGACLLGLGVATVVVAITIFKSRQSRQRQGNTNGGGGGLREVGRRMFQRRHGSSSNTGKRHRQSLIIFRLKILSFASLKRQKNTFHKKSSFLFSRSCLKIAIMKNIHIMLPTHDLKAYLLRCTF